MEGGRHILPPSVLDKRGCRPPQNRRLCFVQWMSSRLTIHPLNLKGPQLNRVVQVLTGHCNLQRHKKITGCAESSLCPNCSLEDETPNHRVGNCKFYHDIRVKYFGITKTTVHNVVTKSNINKLVTYLKFEFDQE